MILLKTIFYMLSYLTKHYHSCLKNINKSCYVFIYIVVKMIIMKGRYAVQDHVIVTINGAEYLAAPEQNLLDLLNDTSEYIPSICYTDVLGPLETCDTCIVSVDGE